MIALVGNKVALFFRLSFQAVGNKAGPCTPVAVYIAADVKTSHVSCLFSSRLVKLLGHD